MSWLSCTPFVFPKFTQKVSVSAAPQESAESSALQQPEEAESFPSEQQQHHSSEPPAAAEELLKTPEPSLPANAPNSPGLPAKGCLQGWGLWPSLQICSLTLINPKSGSTVAHLVEKYVACKKVAKSNPSLRTFWVVFTYPKHEWIYFSLDKATVNVVCIWASFILFISNFWCL